MNQTGIILTGVSSGLGLALVKRGINEGASVFGISRSEPKTDLSENLFRWYQADLSQPIDAQLVVELALKFMLPRNLKRILLINNAGTVAPIGLCGSYPDEEVGRSITLNVTTPILLANAFVSQVPEVMDRGVVNISSGAGRHEYSGWGVYCASKAAIDHFSRVSSVEYPQIKIASLAPGVVDTNMQTNIRQSKEENFPMLERFIQMKEKGQLSSPEEVAKKTIQFLNSDRFGQEVIMDIRDIDHE